jgi:hypothetical protein
MTIVVGILSSVVANVIGLASDSPGWIVFFWIDVVGAGVGGYVAGRRRLDTPLFHGAVSGFAGYVVVAAVGTAINVAGGHGAPSPVQVVFAALWLALGGTLGGYVASWRAQKHRPRPDSP